MWTTDEEGINPVAEVERAEFLQETLSLMLSTLPLREAQRASSAIWFALGSERQRPSRRSRLSS